MKKYLDCEEILKKWEVKKLELFEYVKQGLQPYSADTGKPIPCSHTAQSALRWIRGTLNVIEKYQKSPANLTREEEDWLLAYGAPPQEIIYDCGNELEIIKIKIEKLDISEGDTEDSWKYFHLLHSEEVTKSVINNLFKKALFLKADVERICLREEMKEHFKWIKRLMDEKYWNESHDIKGFIGYVKPEVEKFHIL